MIDEYKAAGVSPASRVPAVVRQERRPVLDQSRAGVRQAGRLSRRCRTSSADLPGFAELVGYKQAGINIVGPPMFALLALDSSNNIVPSQYAKNAKAAGLDIITWTLERSGILAGGNNEFYYQTFDPAIKRDGDVMKVLDVLAQDVGIRGIFSDWAATATYYANCMELK